MMLKSNQNPFFDLITIGAGTAGLSTALAFSEKKLKVLVIDTHEIGGLSTRAQPGRIPVICHYPDIQTQYEYQKTISILFQHFHEFIELRTDPITTGIHYKVQRSSQFSHQFIESYFEKSAKNWTQLVSENILLASYFGQAPYYQKLTPDSQDSLNVIQIYHARDTAIQVESFLLNVTKKLAQNGVCLRSNAQYISHQLSNNTPGKYQVLLNTPQGPEEIWTNNLNFCAGHQNDLFLPLSLRAINRPKRIFKVLLDQTISPEMHIFGPFMMAHPIETGSREILITISTLSHTRDLYNSSQITSEESVEIESSWTDPSKIKRHQAALTEVLQVFLPQVKLVKILEVRMANARSLDLENIRPFLKDSAHHKRFRLCGEIQRFDSGLLCTQAVKFVDFGTLYEQALNLSLTQRSSGR